MDTKDSCGAECQPWWIDNVAYTTEGSGKEFLQCTELASASEIISRKSFTQGTMRNMHILREVPYYLPKCLGIKDLDLHGSSSCEAHIKVLGHVDRLQLMGAAFSKAGLSIINRELTSLPSEILREAKLSVSTLRSPFAEEAERCEPKRLCKWAYAQLEKMDHHPIRRYGSTLTCITAKCKKRRTLSWWTGSVNVFDRDPNAPKDRLKMRTVLFDKSLADKVNEVLAIFIGTFTTALHSLPPRVKSLLVLSNKSIPDAFKSEPLTDEELNHYAALLARAHLITFLNLWRRNTKVHFE